MDQLRDRISDDSFKVVWLSVVELLSPEQIAEQLGLQPKAVHERFCRAKPHLEFVLKARKQAGKKL